MTQDQSIEQIRRVKARHQRRLLELANVVGVGIGLKETGGITTDRPAIIVNVSQKLPLTALAPADVAPTQLDGIPTDVQATGRFSARQTDNAATGPPAKSPAPPSAEPDQPTGAAAGTKIYRRLADSLTRLFYAGGRHDS